MFGKSKLEKLSWQEKREVLDSIDKKTKFFEKEKSEKRIKEAEIEYFNRLYPKHNKLKVGSPKKLPKFLGKKQKGEFF